MAASDIPPVVRAASIVVLGSFNPAILQPMWLAQSELISKSDADTADIDVITRQAALFETSWFKLQCLEDRFQIETTNQARFLDARDLAINVFRILEHTPLHAFGFNASVQIEMETNEAWHRFGHECTPKQVWDKFLKKPGMRSLVIEGARDGSSAAYLQIKVEPARGVTNGVNLHFNEHYRLDKDKSQFDRVREFINKGEHNFMPFQKYTDDVTAELMSLYFQEGASNGTG